MKRLLCSTTILSLVMMPMAPAPIFAQVLDEEGRILAADGTILCAPTAELTCDPQNEDIIKAAEEIQARLDAEAAAQAEAAAAAAQAAADAAAQAEAAAAAQAAADAAAQAEAAAAAQAAADAAAQAEAAAAAQAAADAAAQAEAEAAAQAAADAAAQAEAEAAAQAAADAAAQAEAEAAAQAAADAAAQAEAEAAAQAAADAAAQAEAEAAAQAAADAAAQAEAEAAAQAAADAAAQAEAEAAAQAAADAAAQTEAEAAAQAAADAAAQTEAEAAAQTALDAAAQAEAEAAAAQAAADAAAQAEALAEAEAETIAPDGTPIDPLAGLMVQEVEIDPNAPPVDAPVVSETEAQALSEILTASTQDAAAPEVAAASLLVPPPPPPLPVEPALGVAAPIDPATAEAALLAIPAPANTVATTVETIAADQTRRATQEFSAPPQTLSEGKKTGLSDLERVGLFVLGAVVIGQMINAANDTAQNAQTVVSNSGDRVVVRNGDGSYGLYKDDDAILRQAGSTVRTETYTDGSSRTIVQRGDGTQVVTVRDASGRVLRRAQYDQLGRELVLLDDFNPEVPVRVSDLPRPRPQLSTRSDDAALRAAIAARQIERFGRTFSLRQIREIPQVRALAAEVGVERVTFSSGSSAITPQQANALADLGGLMLDMLAQNPAEMFLIEGHTDATGAAAMNLALSDRRAETVALALTEYFGIPPENMIVQGYGETELRINTQADEPLNRRVAVRIITPLLR